MTDETVPRGTKVVARGDIGDAFYVKPRGARIARARDDARAQVVKAGKVAVLGAKNEIVATLGDGAFFGETAILKDTPRNADVVSVGDAPTALLKLTRDDFVERLGPLEDALRAEADRRNAALAQANSLA